MIKQYNPEFTLDHRKRGLLAQTISTEGYSVLNDIYSSEISKFILDVINTDDNDEKAVISAFRLAKAAAQFHEAVTARLNFEVGMYTNAERKTDKPVDFTANLYIEPASTIDDLREDALSEEGVLYELGN